MTTAIEYALMAGASYISNRADLNKFPVPQGWVKITNPDSYVRDPSTGFEAVSFTNGTEVVISYAGTDFSQPINDFAFGNIPLAIGLVSDQLKQAAEYYLQIKALNPNVTITGHSLGGGIASLIGVFFGETTFTFDQAPFYLTASLGANTLKSYLLDAGHTEAELQGLTNFIHQQDLNGGVPNQGLVTNYNVQGEIVSAGSGLRIGSDSSMPNTHPGVSSIDLHSQALLTAFFQSNQTAATNQSLLEVTPKLTDLLKMFFDSKLFAHPVDRSNTTDENFLEHLVRHEEGVQGSFEADAMVTRFTKDLWKLAQEGGLTMSDSDGFATTDLGNVSKTLIAFAMQMYYEDTANAKDPSKELFTAITGGVTFDMADVSPKILAAFTQSTHVDLKDAKGYEEYFSQYLYGAGTNFSEEERSLIAGMLPTMRDWYVQAGTTGMNTTDTHNRHAFMLGGLTDDSLTGGNKSDLLVGNAGADTLTGGEGDDYLLGGSGTDTLKGEDGNDQLAGGIGSDDLNGGAGNDMLKGGDGSDTYTFTDSFGTDIITDSDGSGSIQVNGQALNSATKQFEDIYKNNATGYTVTKLNGGASLVLTKEGDSSTNPSRIIINDWSESNNLSISLTGDMPAAPAGNVMNGDFKKKVDDNNNYVIENNNYVDDGAEANALDLINGTGGTDVIDGKGGSDYLNGKAGNDYISGGTEGDYIQGGMGKDTLIGGKGDDLIYGSSDADIGMPGGVNFTKPVNEWTHAQATGFNWTLGYNDSDVYSNGTPSGYSRPAPRNRLADDESNLIDGGAGNDFIAAGTGADYVHGGEDKDFIFGMDKDDILFGDAGNDVIYGDGNKQSDTSVVWTLPENHGNDIIDGGDGDDLLLGQGGHDIIFGGKDNDKIWGDDPTYYTELAGNDILFGGAGNDHLDGGAGNDHLDGGEDDDTLLGGDGNDTLVTNSGNDILVGGANDDTYLINSAGVIRIVDTEGNNTLRFGANNNPANLKLRVGSLMLDFGNGNQVHIENFNQSDVFNTTSFSGFEFADGTTLTINQLLARGFDLDGTDADDSISGTNITDRMNGLAGDDTLAGFQGDDIINGGTGNDYLYGGDGTDTLIGDEGDDQIVGDAGDDAIDGGQGADNLFGEAGSDTINGGDGNDQLIGDGATTEGAADLLNGGNGADTLWGQAGNDTLNGGADNDALQGGDGNDILNGGTGDDQLYGDAGNDTYLLNLGDGHDYIQDTDGTHKIIFGAGITLQNISVAFPNPASNAAANSKNLVIHYGEGNSVTVSALSINAMTFQFANGQTLSYTNLKTAFPNPIYTAPNSVIYGSQYNDYLNTPSTGGVIHAGSGNDYLIGDNGNDQLYGDGGSDTLYGNNGNDILEGGLGKDALNGGNGSDVYVFKRGDGQDILSDYRANETEINTLQFGADITANDVSYTHAASGVLVIRINNSTDSITINNWYSSPVNQLQVIKYGDGSQQDLAAVNSLDIADIVATQNGSTLNGDGYNNRLVGGAGNDTLIGGLGSDTLIGGAGVDTYVLGWTRGGTLGDDRVVDPDIIIESNDSTESNIIALPLGLDFNGLEIEKRGNDLYIGVQGSRNVDYFNLQENSNNAYSDFTPDGMLIKDYYSGSQVWQVKMADGSVRTMADLIQEANQAPTDFVQSAYDDWVVGHRQSIMADAILVTTYGVTGQQIDSNHFELFPHYGRAVYGLDFAETYSNEDTIYRISDYEHYQYEETGSYSKVISGGQYSFPQSQATYNGTYAIPIYDYGNLDAGGNPTFSGFLEGGGSSNDGSVSYTVTVAATNVYSALVLDKLQAGDSDNFIDLSQSGIMAVFAGAGNDIITNFGSLNSSIGSFLNGEDGNDVIIGSFEDDVILAGNGNDYLAGGQGDDTYLININDVGVKLVDEGFSSYLNAHPSSDTVEFGPGVSINDIHVTRGTVITPNFPNFDDLSRFSFDQGAYEAATLDITWGDSTQIVRVVLPGINVDPGDFRYFTNSNGQTFLFESYNASYGIEYYKFSDGTILTATQMEALAVTTPANHAPIINSAIADLTTFEDAAFSFTLPTDSFADVDDGDILAYSVSLTDGSELPVWLSFDATTQTFSGTPTNNNIGSLSLMLTATDLAGASVNQVFNLAVQNTNDAPIVVNAIAHQSVLEDSTFTFVVPANTFTDVDAGDMLSYTATLVDGTALPSWINFDAVTRIFSGTPLNANVGSLQVKLTAIDVAGVAISQTFDLNVTNVNDAPTAIGNIADVNVIDGNALSMTLPVATLFVDPDAGDQLTYAVTLADGSALPAWLSFDPTALLISGTPHSADIGSLSLQVTATDIAGTTANVNFNLSVSAMADQALTGTAANDVLTGGSGNDTLNGLAGTDTMTGGYGNDIYYVERSTDKVIEEANQGTDTINTTVTYTLGANVENLVLLGTSSIAANGNELDNQLIGNAGSNTLDGKAGADQMAGGLGNDTYIVDDVSDVVTELENEGTDTIKSGVGYTLGDHQERLTLTGVEAINGTGNNLNNIMIGNDAANQLSGHDGNDNLNGGLGADTLIGGLGNDIYIVENTLDTIIEQVGEGTDTVQSSVTYTLSAEVENLTLTGTATINGEGNELNNTITGNAADNQLMGHAGNDNLNGGVGADTMIGGLGNDIYTVDNANDVVIEQASEGADRVNSSINYTLGNDLENLTLTGTAAINGSGNELNNTITGNAADNQLIGNAGNDNLNGGLGADTMIGGLGNDSFTVDNINDIVIEQVAEGTDRVNSGISYTLGNDLENLTLTGTTDINGWGNGLANMLTGNTGHNYLFGLDGNDTLTGNAGNDVLQGGEGADTLSSHAGKDVLDGGAGADRLNGGTEHDLFIGGLGNDITTTGTGYDVIAFNKGDGQDIISASTGADNTISLGGNFAYSDLSLTKTGNNLILKVGSSDQITLQNWYASGGINKSVVNLQVISEAMQGFSLGSADDLRNNKIENFNFADIVSQFEAAGATANWQLTDARLTTHLQAGSDSAAIGGDLAYQYGMNSNLTGMGLSNTQSVIAAANFGQSAQTLNNPSVWQAEVVKLA